MASATASPTACDPAASPRPRLDHKPHAAGAGTSGVDWNHALGVPKALLFSPILGFVLAALLLLAMRLVIHNKALY